MSSIQRSPDASFANIIIPSPTEQLNGFKQAVKSRLSLVLNKKAEPFWTLVINCRGVLDKPGRGQYATATWLRVLKSLVFPHPGWSRLTSLEIHETTSGAVVDQLAEVFADIQLPRVLQVTFTEVFDVAFAVVNDILIPKEHVEGLSLLKASFDLTGLASMNYALNRLLTLDLVGCPPRHASAFLAHVRMPRLRHLRLATDGRKNVEQIQHTILWARSTGQPDVLWENFGRLETLTIGGWFHHDQLLNMLEHTHELKRLEIVAPCANGDAFDCNTFLRQLSRYTDPFGCHAPKMEKLELAWCDYSMPVLSDALRSRNARAVEYAFQNISTVVVNIADYQKFFATEWQALDGVVDIEMRQFMGSQKAKYWRECYTGQNRAWQELL